MNCDSKRESKQGWYAGTHAWNECDTQVKVTFLIVFIDEILPDVGRTLHFLLVATCVCMLVYAH